MRTDGFFHASPTPPNVPLVLQLTHNIVFHGHFSFTMALPQARPVTRTREVTGSYHFPLLPVEKKKTEHCLFFPTFFNALSFSVLPALAATAYSAAMTFEIITVIVMDPN